jgi:hypothetical protein
MGGGIEKNAKKVDGGYLMVNLALSPMIERRALIEAKKKTTKNMPTYLCC